MAQTYFTLGLCKQDQMSLYRDELETPFLEVFISVDPILDDEIC